MVDTEFYRQQVEDAETHAEQARSEHDRAAWLWLARSWQDLLKARLQTPQDQSGRWRSNIPAPARISQNRRNSA